MHSIEPGISTCQACGAAVDDVTSGRLPMDCAGRKYPLHGDLAWMYTDRDRIVALGRPEQPDPPDARLVVWHAGIGWIDNEELNKHYVTAWQRWREAQP